MKVFGNESKAIVGGRYLFSSLESSTVRKFFQIRFSFSSRNFFAPLPTPALSWTPAKESSFCDRSTGCRLIFICRCCANKLSRKKVRRNFLSHRLSHVPYFSALGFPRLLNILRMWNRKENTSEGKYFTSTSVLLPFLTFSPIVRVFGISQVWTFKNGFKKQKLTTTMKMSWEFFWLTSRKLQVSSSWSLARFYSVRIFLFSI